VAALLPNKCQLLIVKALATLQDLPWTASLVGTLEADPAYAEQVRAAISTEGLEDRIRLTGQLVGDALAEEWHRADLSLLVSRAEAFGLVVTESLARGIPVIVRDGTGAMDALALGTAGQDHGGNATHPGSNGRANALPGTAVELTGPEHNQPGALARVIREWLSDAGLRADWQTRALAARQRLPRWDATARDVLGMFAASLPEPTPDETGSTTSDGPRTRP
jgi:glycosyltransferase involved in cell wall biosynthesis